MQVLNINDIRPVWPGHPTLIEPDRTSILPQPGDDTDRQTCSHLLLARDSAQFWLHLLFEANEYH